jgi:hypothetical protein
MAVPLPDEVKELLDGPNYVHLSTLRADGSPRNWVVWAGREGDHILILVAAGNAGVGAWSSCPPQSYLAGDVGPLVLGRAAG